MDIVKCAVLALLETYPLALVQPGCRNSFWQIWVVLLLVQYLTLKCYNIFIYPHLVSPLKDLPGPKDSTPFFGQFLKEISAVPADPQISWMRENPSADLIRYLGFANSDNVLLVSPQAHREFMHTKCYDFVKPEIFRRLVSGITGIGLLFLEGEEHKHHRKLLTGPFSVSNAKNVIPLLEAKAQELCAVLTAKLQKDPNSPLEVLDTFSAVALDIIGTVSIGLELDSLTTSSPFAESYKKVFDFSPMAQVMAVLNMYIPVRKWLPLKVNKDFVSGNATVKKLLTKEVSKKRQLIMENGDVCSYEGSNGKNLLRRDLLTLMFEETAGKPDAWTEDRILGHLLTFMSAGHETTAVILAWSALILGQHPDMQTRLRTEVATVPAILSFEEIESLSYLNNFTNEVLRYYPPSFSQPREAAHDVYICGQLIPKGTVVSCFPRSLHFNPTVWGDHAEKFDPDRWDNLPPPAKDPFAFQTFTTGPRVCIGKTLAILEIKVLLARLVQHFEFESTEGELVPNKGGLTLRPSGGAKVTMKIIA